MFKRDNMVDQMIIYFTLYKDIIKINSEDQRDQSDYWKDR